MTTPRYQDVQGKDVPVVTDDDGTSVRIVCGNFWGTSGPVDGIAHVPPRSATPNDNREVGSQRRPPHPAGYEGTTCSVGRKTGASCEDDSGKTRNESCEADEDLLHGVEHPLSRLVSVPLPLTARDGVRSAQGEGRSAEGRYRPSTSRLSRHELQMPTIRTKRRQVDAPSASFPRARMG